MSNIVKDTAKELGMTYKELAEEIGYSEGAVRNSSSAKAEVSLSMTKAIALYVENLQLKKKLESTDVLKNALKDLIK